MKIPKKLLIGILGITISTISGIIYHQGGIEIKYGKSNIGSFNQTSNSEDIIYQFSGLQNITGILFQGPLTPSQFKIYSDFFLTPSSQLSIWIYQITYDKIKSLLYTVASRSPLHMILEDQQFKQIKTKNPDERWKQHPNTQVISDKNLGTKYVHAKTVVGDHHAIIQSANFSYSSYFKNTEHFFLTKNPSIVKNLNTLFTKDRSGNRIVPDDIHPNLVICNINCRGVIEHLLKSATSSITIQTQYITDPDIQNILIEKIPLDIKIVVADTDSNDRIEKLLGNQIVKRQKKPYVHDKSILIDDKIVLIGSMNLSANSLDNNREIGILLIDPALIKTFKEHFQSNRKKL